MCAFIRTYDLGNPIKGMRIIPTKRADKIWCLGTRMCNVRLILETFSDQYIVAHDKGE